MGIAGRPAARTATGEAANRYTPGRPGGKPSSSGLLRQQRRGAAYGAALLAGVRAGVFADVADAVERCVRVRETIEPEWDYEDAYARFRSLYPTLKELR